MKKKSHKKEKRILVLLQDNYGWVTALIAILGTLTTSMIKFIEYITADAVLSYYDIDINLYRTSELNIIYTIGKAIIIVLALFSAIYCFDKLIHSKNKKIKDTIYYIAFILLSNLYFVHFLYDNPNFIHYIVMIIVETIISIGDNIIPDDFNKKIEGLLLKTTKISFIIISAIILVYTATYYTKKKEYRIIDDNKAIIYTTTDYYIVLDCKIKEQEKELFLYKGKQTKIDTTNVHTTLREFDNVEIE